MAELSLLILHQIVVNCCASETPHVKIMKGNFGLLDQDSLWLDKMFDRWLSDTPMHCYILFVNESGVDLSQAKLI